MSLDRVLGMDIEWVLYHIVHNSPDFTDLSLDVDFYNDDVWSRLLASLRLNSIITNVRIERHLDGEGERSSEEIESLCLILSQIPSIERLTILATSMEDIDAAIPLFRHRNLQYCHLDWSGIEDDDSNFVSTDVGQALGGSESLVDIVLEDPPVDGCSLLLVPLLESKTLRSIKLQSYSASTLGQDDARLIFQELCINSSLIHFSLGYLLDAEANWSVPEMIRGLQGLKELRLTMAISEDMGDFLRSFMRAMGENHTLSSFENCSADATMVTEDIEQLQIDMLVKNMNLEYISIFKERSDVLLLRKTIFLQLNSGGRRNLFRVDRNGRETSPPQEWLEVMGRTCENLDCLFYCLSMNPSLCKMVQYTKERTGGKRKR